MTSYDDRRMGWPFATLHIDAPLDRPPLPLSVYKEKPVYSEEEQAERLKKDTDPVKAESGAPKEKVAAAAEKISTLMADLVSMFKTLTTSSRLTAIALENLTEQYTGVRPQERREDTEEYIVELLNDLLPRGWKTDAPPAKGWYAVRHVGSKLVAARAYVSWFDGSFWRHFVRVSEKFYSVQALDRNKTIGQSRPEDVEWLYMMTPSALSGMVHSPPGKQPKAETEAVRPQDILDVLSRINKKHGSKTQHVRKMLEDAFGESTRLSLLTEEQCRSFMGMILDFEGMLNAEADEESDF